MKSRIRRIPKYPFVAVQCNALDKQERRKRRRYHWELLARSCHLLKRQMQTPISKCPPNWRIKPLLTLSLLFMNIKVGFALSVMALATACASVPTPNPALESARAVVQSAEADPNVSRYASLDLAAVKNELAVAEAAALHHENEAHNQPAYLASKNARMAHARAAACADDSRVAAGQIERNAIQLAARAREVDNARVARDKACAEAARLQPEMDALKENPTDCGLFLTLGDVLFRHGQSGIKARCEPHLEPAGAVSERTTTRHVNFDSFTDNVASAEYNQGLSQRCADAVKYAIQTRGIDPSRIAARGYGGEYPVAGNTETGGRQLNRRVEVVIGGDNGSAIAARDRV